MSKVGYLRPTTVYDPIVAILGLAGLAILLVTFASIMVWVGGIVAGWLESIGWF
jgi:hypothetical protein